MSAAPSPHARSRSIPALACAVVVLALLGAIMVGSASITIADRQTLGAEPLAYLYRHLGALALGGVGMARRDVAADGALVPPELAAARRRARVARRRADSRRSATP